VSQALLRSRRFLPLFVTQALGALNDNLFKNAIIVLVLFRGSGQAWLVPLAGGIFILPYALFSAIAGKLADRLDKARLIRLTKLYEVVLMALAGVGFLTGSEWFLLLVLFGLGVQATFFGPLKYGILPELLAPGELVEGNGLIEASTFIGILAGTVAGGELILLGHGRAITAVAALLVALVGWAAARGVPATAPAAPELRFSPNIAAETWRLLSEARSERIVWRCILALSWFWVLGATFLAEFPVIVKQGFGANGQVVTLMLAVFSVGVGVGSMLAAALLRGAISARPVVPAAVLLTLFTLDFAWAAGGVTPANGWRDVGALLAHAGGWRVLFDLFAVAMCGGVFSVPLYALLQNQARPEWRARMVAANNVMNAVFIVVGAALLTAGAMLHLAPATLLAVFGVANAAVAVAIWRVRLP
jgi:acyl-[acyl-carrier-protein]-phospholipid O-acyltransferase/long-chain-fatty-acid--[acyl-carrier-protein] ligase